MYYLILLFQENIVLLKVSNRCLALFNPPCSAPFVNGHPLSLGAPFDVGFGPDIPPLCSPFELSLF